MGAEQEVWKMSLKTERQEHKNEMKRLQMRGGGVEVEELERMRGDADDMGIGGEEHA